MRFCLLFCFSFTHKMHWCLFYWICIHRDWRGSNPQLPPWQGGALTNWTTIPGKKAYSIHILMVSFKLFLFFSIFYLDSNRCAVTERKTYFCFVYIEIYRSIWICTLVRSTRITSNPFFIAKSIEKWINEKKKEFFLFISIFS